MINNNFDVCTRCKSSFESPESLDKLQRIIMSLPRRRYWVLFKRVVEEKTLQDTGREYGVTRERILQLERQAFDHIISGARRMSLYVDKDDISYFIKKNASKFPGVERKEVFQISPDFDQIKFPIIVLKELLPKSDSKIEELELGVRAYNCLKASGIHDVQSVINMSDDELLAIKNMGHMSLKEIREAVDNILDEDESDWT